MAERKPDAETIIAKYLAACDDFPPGNPLQIEAIYRAAAQDLLRELRDNGYSLIYGADHKFLKED